MNAAIQQAREVALGILQPSQREPVSSRMPEKKARRRCRSSSAWRAAAATSSARFESP
jgi:hypothetical protein